MSSLPLEPGIGLVERYVRMQTYRKPKPGVYQRLFGEVEKYLIEEILKHTKGNRSRTAEILGINRNTLLKRTRKYGIDARRFMSYS